MEMWQQYLMSEGYERLALAARLNDEESKNDPDEEPFRSRYQSREILIEVKDKLKDILGDDEINKDGRLFYSALNLKFGINYIETEETHSGEEALNKCMDELEKYKLDNMACNIYQSALNQVGILSCDQSNYPKAMSSLERAESLYKQFKSEVGVAPWAADEFLKPPSVSPELLESQREANFENTYTLTLYYMAQIFAKTDQSEKSAKYCQVTLQRQLESGQYDPVDWALNSATLSQYYITVENFSMARHCLASASRIFQEAGASISEEESEESMTESINQRKADIDRCWVKYGLMLMEYSREKLFKEVEDMDLNKENGDGTDQQNTNTDSVGDSTQDEMKQKMSLKFNLELTSLEEQISCEQLNVFSDAREVFLLVQKWINSAKEFYSLDSHCSDHIELIQDHSRAFKLLAFYEMSMERQCKMHKRRVDMLTAVLNEINSQHYLLVCRQLMYEIAETYSTMLDLKLAIVESDGGTPSAHAVNKINSLAQQSIGQFQSYIDSLKGGKPDLPEKFDDMDLRPALIAKFCMGRLYSKLLTPNLSERIANMEKSLDCYKFLVDYCKIHPDTEKVVKSELGICTEMVELLPLKMAQARLTG